MRLRIVPGGLRSGDVRVPGDKSIGHRWLMLAATARGTSRLAGLPPSLDVRSTADCLSKVTGRASPGLEAWARNAAGPREGHGSTWNGEASLAPDLPLEVEGEGRSGLVQPRSALDCGNSGTAMRLLAGILAGVPFPSVLTGDDSLSRRPMERVAEPLRAMGASIATSSGHAPLEIAGRPLRGVTYRAPVPTAQVKGAILLAALGADGRTEVEEPLPTRDHTERALAALGAPIDIADGRISLERFQHDGFEGTVPGDPSTAAFLIAAAALTGSACTVVDVGLNPSRLRFLDVMTRMGVRTEPRQTGVQLGEPVGEIHVASGTDLAGTRVEAAELPAVVDEVPILAMLGAHARGETRFVHASELRMKESDRLLGTAAGVQELGGNATTEGDDLLVTGGGLRGGATDARGDHRLAMAFAVASLAAAGPCVVEGIEAADVSYPGFVGALRALGAELVVTT